METRAGAVIEIAEVMTGLVEMLAEREREAQQKHHQQQQQ